MANMLIILPGASIMTMDRVEKHAPRTFISRRYVVNFIVETHFIPYYQRSIIQVIFYFKNIFQKTQLWHIYLYEIVPDPLGLITFAPMR